MMLDITSAPMTSTLLHGAAVNHLGAHRQRVGERRARRRQIEAPRARRADLVLHQAGGAGKQHVGRDGADDDQVDVVRGQSGLLDRDERGLLREVRRRHAGIDDVTLANAGALHDPLVGGFDQLLEIGVGQQRAAARTSPGS